MDRTDHAEVKKFIIKIIYEVLTAHLSFHDVDDAECHEFTIDAMVNMETAESRVKAFVLCFSILIKLLKIKCSRLRNDRIISIWIK